MRRRPAAYLDAPVSGGPEGRPPGAWRCSWGRRGRRPARGARPTPSPRVLRGWARRAPARRQAREPGAGRGERAGRRRGARARGGAGLRPGATAAAARRGLGGVDDARAERAAPRGGPRGWPSSPRRRRCGTRQGLALVRDAAAGRGLDLPAVRVAAETVAAAAARAPRTATGRRSRASSPGRRPPTSWRAAPPPPTPSRPRRRPRGAGGAGVAACRSSTTTPRARRRCTAWPSGRTGPT